MFRCCSAALFAMLLVSLISVTKSTLAATAVIEKPGIRYCDRDSAKSLLDLYLPPGKADGLRPGVLLIHGGGWTGGNRGQWRKLALLLAGRGYVCASASYRLYPPANAFDMIADVRTAMDWFKAHATEYGMDPERIGAVGSSAGGHLVALLATIRPGEDLGDPEHSLKFDTRPNAVVCYNPVLDFITEKRIQQHVDARISSKQGAEAIADYMLLSPARRVTAGMPPFLFLYGNHDTLTPVETCGGMVAGMRSLGIMVRIEMFGGMEHGFGYSLDPGESYRAALATADFFDSTLKGAQK